MKLAVAVQNLKLDNNDFQKPNNFEISLYIIYNRKLGGKKGEFLKNIFVPLFKNPFPSGGKSIIYLGVLFKLKS